MFYSSQGCDGQFRPHVVTHRVIAICIDHRELYRLGMLMDEIFKEENRIAVINWQKAFSPKNDSKHVSTATEYVVYAKDINRSKTGLLPRDEKSDRFFNNIDNDPQGEWAGKDPTENTVFGIQSPFTGTLHYPDFEHTFNFKTVKPLKLCKKIIQLWCRPEGIVLDPFAGSGTTAHAVLDLNHEVGTNRRFILIEQGNTENGDNYARSLTADRIRRVVTGEWASGKCAPIPGGGFRFIELKHQKIDAEAVNTLAREEMIDLLLTSYWDKAEKAKSYLRRLPLGQHQYLFAANPKNEGLFRVWDSADRPSILNREVFRSIAEEAKAASLVSHYHVYASIAPYTGAGIEFYKIPDKVLEPCAGPHKHATPAAMQANGFAPDEPASLTVEVDGFCS